MYGISIVLKVFNYCDMIELNERGIYMINLNEFIEKQNHESFYALVTYNGVTEPTYFCTVDLDEEGLLDLHSPCEVFKRFEGSEKIEAYFNWIMTEECGLTKEDIDEFYRPLVVDDVYYDVENFQCAPYLPEEVDDIEICTERDSLLYVLEHSKK